MQSIINSFDSLRDASESAEAPPTRTTIATPELIFPQGIDKSSECCDSYKCGQKAMRLRV